MCGDLQDIFLRVFFRGVIDENIEVTKFTNCSGYRPTTERLLSDISRNQKAPPSIFLDHPLGFLRVAVLVEIDDRNIRSLPCERHSDCPSNAAVATRDDGNFVLQFAGSPGPRGLRLWPWFHFPLDSRLIGLVLCRKSLRPTGRFGFLLALPHMTLLFQTLELRQLSGQTIAVEPTRKGRRGEVQ
jgi:hypothetical protein